ncbi:MAG: hypothetical protein ABIR32_08020 [Ilumatobacteraceae bacterium]
MNESPTYLPLLNAAAANEAANATLFTAWAANTRDAAARAMLHTVALREADHAIAFARRIDELGFAVIERDEPTLAERVAVASSPDLGDRVKFERLGFGAPRKDVFGSLFADVTIDIQTASLLGRYIATERDSARRIDAAYAALVAAGD